MSATAATVVWAVKNRRRIVSLLLGVFVAVGCAAVFVAVLAAPAAAPVIVASTVLGDVADVFGSGSGGLSGDELAKATGGEAVRCDAAPPADPPPVPASATAVPDPAAAVDPDSGEPAPEPASPAVPPIRIGEGGSISREDAETLLAPVPEGTNTLRAHVWFLYRLAGMGDWDQFTAAYAQAGLSPAEESVDAPLRQVQALNATGAAVERYRLTAAALVSAGEQTGRFEDPYPEYRDLVVTELVSSCLTEAPTESRMTLPAPSITSAVPTPDAVPTQSAAPTWQLLPGTRTA